MAIVGSVEAGSEQLLTEGLCACLPLASGVVTREQALGRARRLVEELSAHVAARFVKGLEMGALSEGRVASE